MSRDTMNALIQEFGATVGATEMAFDEDDYLAFTSAEGVLVNVDYFEQDETLVLYTTIGELSDDFRFEFYDEMLKANLFWELTLGATLCVSPDGNHALLTACVSTADLDVVQLTNFFQHVNRLTLIWADRLRQIAAGEGDAEAPPAPRNNDSEPHVYA
jgi:Tir chaperone protein (CesT) family